MAQIGTKKIQTASAPREVPVYDVSDVANDYLRVVTASGVGAIPVVDPADATSDEYRVITPAGPMVIDPTALPDNTIDDFEDNDLSEWSTTQNITITSTTPIEGEYSIQFTGEMVAGARPYSLSGDGLDYYPQKGDKFSALLYEDPNNIAVPGFCFGVSNNTNGIDGYSVISLPSNNELVVRRLDDGSTTDILRPSVTLSAGQTYEFEVQWHDGSGAEPDDTIEVTIYETDGTADLSAALGRNSQVHNDTVIDATYANNTGVGLTTATADPGVDGRADRYWHLGDVE